MLNRVLDGSYPEETRRHIGALTISRLTANACFRFAPPFFASIGDSLHVSLGRLGLAFMVTEIVVGLMSLAGGLVDRLGRRSAMVIGLSGVSASTVLAASSRHVVLFAVAVTILGLAKSVFDMGLNAWVNDHVDYARRGRVVGIIETSWALGLLVGVSLMGLVAAATSWRWGYVTGAIGVATMSLVLTLRLDPHDEHITRVDDVADAARLPRSGLLVVATMGFLMAASQSIFVTFGSWLEDEFDFSSAAIAGVVFGLGAFELTASITSSRRVDQWGKERSTIIGALLIVPSGILLAMLSGHVGPGLVLLGVYLLGFEFSIVCLIPVATNMMPTAPAKGLGVTYTGGMLGRASMSLVATAAYERFGIGAPALIGAACALAAVACIAAYSRARPQPR
jgi:MFS transporter, DHA1 family, inner membrane transport protein